MRVVREQKGLRTHIQEKGNGAAVGGRKGGRENSIEINKERVWTESIIYPMIVSTATIRMRMGEGEGVMRGHGGEPYSL